MSVIDWQEILGNEDSEKDPVGTFLGVSAEVVMHFALDHPDALDPTYTNYETVVGTMSPGQRAALDAIHSSDQLTDLPTRKIVTGVLVLLKQLETAQITDAAFRTIFDDQAA